MQEEPYWEEAVAFTRAHCLQRDCEVEVHSMDRAGTFQGTVRFGRLNLGGEPRHIGAKNGGVGGDSSVHECCVVYHA